MSEKYHVSIFLICFDDLFLGNGKYVVYKNKRGNYQLEHNGYKYSAHVRNTRNHSKLKYWRCQKQTNGSICKGRAILHNDKLLVVTVAHNHAPEQKNFS